MSVLYMFTIGSLIYKFFLLSLEIIKKTKRNLKKSIRYTRPYKSDVVH